MTMDPYEAAEEAIQAWLDASLSPRGPESLFDYVGDFALARESVVLDLGCNMGTFSLALSQRFKCRVVGIDIDPYYIEQAAKQAREHGIEQSVSFRVGSAESIPAESGTFDAVWCRDVLELVGDLDATYREIFRVLKPGRRALIYTMCATDLLEPLEASALYAGLGDIKAQSMLPGSHDDAIGRSGLTVVSREVLGAEWGEFAAETTGKPARCLLQVARLLRSKESFVRQFGESNYETAIADRLWHVYRMIGKLSGLIYVLQKPADS
jgi:SAM-dependent methyltransferase